MKVPNFVDSAWKSFNDKKSKVDDENDEDGMDIDAELNDNDELGKVRVVIDPFRQRKQRSVCGDAKCSRQ